MSIDEIVTAETATDVRRRRLWLPVTGVVIACLLMVSTAGWAWWNNSQQNAARSSHDSVVLSVTPMPVLWQQLALPLDQRSIPTIESASRLGMQGTDIRVSTQLRVNEPNRIGVVTTVTSDGITTLLLTMVRDLPGETYDAFQNGCDAFGPAPSGDGLTCEQFIDQQVATWTVRN